MTANAPAPDELDGFGDEARRAVDHAEHEARGLGHDRVGTEHLLLGLLVEASTPASVALTRAGVTAAAARHQVVEAVGPTGGRPGRRGAEPLPRTARAGRALGRSLRFSHQRRATAVGTEDLLLAVLDVEGTAGQVLRKLGLDLDRLRADLGPAVPPADAEADAPVERDESDERDERDEAAAPTDAAEAAALWCPSCGADLEAHAVVRTLTLQGRPDASAEDRGIAVPVLACGTCATFLGTVPG